MKNKKWIMLPALLAVTTILIHAQQFNPESDFVVTRNDEGNGVIILEYVGTGQIINIPPTIRGLPVTIIGENAFEEKNITRVTIPKRPPRLDWGAFDLTPSTMQIEVPEGSVAVYRAARHWAQIADRISAIW